MSWTESDVMEALDVSRETSVRLITFAELLTRWNPKINIVAKATIDDLWRRHVADSAQLLQFAPPGERWADLGSGGGLPGLVLAAIAKERRTKSSFTLIESDRRKCAFMETAAREMGVDAQILNRRIETLNDMEFDIISARALAPLPRLLSLAAPLLSPGGACLFPKGARAADELTEARRHWHMKVETLPSATNPDASILRITELARADAR